MTAGWNKCNFAKGERTSPKTGKHRDNFDKTQAQHDAMNKGKIGRPPGSKNKK